MRTWRFWRLVILAVLLAGLAWTLVSRGATGRFGGRAIALETPYKTEHEWVVRAIATDIETMAAFAGHRQVRPFSNPPSIVPWEPDSFSGVAADAFAHAPSGITFRDDLYPALTESDPAALVAASKTVSQSLASNMLDPRAHESAALVLGTFALHDAADKFTDTRWAMNRMTAHLAVAKALRQSDELSPDGAIAAVILSALANQQARATRQLVALGAGSPSESMRAWTRALHMRVNRDWRDLADPATATRLEKLEYFRARRAAVRRRRAGEELQRVNEEVSADFARLAQDSGVGFEDGYQFTVPALELELAEARATYQLIHGQPMAESPTESLNQRASNLMASAQPVVLPWGAWAEFFQRHIAMNVGQIDAYYRYFQGDAVTADAVKAQLDRRLGGLMLFPVGTLRRTKGTAATEADETLLPEIVALTSKAPELITAPAWHFNDMGSKYEPVAWAMPPVLSWFTPPTAAVPYEAGVRHVLGLRPAANDLEALINAAPTDVVLLVSASEGAAQDPIVVRARRLLQDRHAFDLAALDPFLAREKDDRARVELLRSACDLSARDCLELAKTLARFGDDDQVAATYEKAFADPMIDQLALANDAEWLVDYYRRRLRLDDAVALAERAASLGSATGLGIRARLRERLADFDGAESDLTRIVSSCECRHQMLAFYYRRVEVAHDERYRQRWDKWRAETFPQGLQPEPTSMSETPKTGVYIYQDSLQSRAAGIRAGDIVVGLEGWRVDTQEQYQAINEFFDRPLVKLTLWRGGLVKVEAQSPNRLFGTQLRTHPMKGWIQ